MTHSKVIGNFLVNTLHAYQRFNRRYHVKNRRKKKVGTSRLMWFGGCGKRFEYIKSEKMKQKAVNRTEWAAVVQETKAPT